MFQRTRAINKLLKLTKRIRVIPGGTSAGKTYGILPILIDKASKVPNLEISVVSESVPHLRKGALKDFLKILKETGRYVDSQYNRTHLTYYFTNGSYIEFFSVEDESKVRGPRRNILYVNECNSISFETYHQLAIRTSQDIWLDFNPSHEFWVHKELIADEDTEWLTLTYIDNEALPITIIKEIEKALFKGFHDPHGNVIDDEPNVKDSYWANWWRVYGLGLLGSLEGVVFNNWTIVDSIPEEAKYVATGLDFGYTNDPTAIVDVYYLDGKRYLDQMCYLTGLLNSDISKILRDSYIKRKVWADSAEPKSIEEIKRTGVNISGVKKGSDSILFGVQTMQQQEYFVTKRSTELIKEFRGYLWAKDKSGNYTGKPADYLNHAIDAIRYEEMMEIGMKNKFFVI